MYHFVWIPKYRHKIFVEPFRGDLKAIIQKIGYGYDIEIVELEIPVDHIHWLWERNQKIRHRVLCKKLKVFQQESFFEYTHT